MWQTTVHKTLRWILAGVATSLAMTGVNAAQEKPASQERTVGRQETRPDAPSVRPYPKLHALCIGINDYAAANVPDLSYAEADAREMAQVLKDLYGFDTVRVLLGKDATKAAINMALAELFNPDKIGPDDGVVIYFSGHGQTIRQGRAEAGYLIPQDANISLKEIANPEPYRRDALRMDDLRTDADGIPARHVLFLVDACYSGFLASKSLAEAAPEITNALKYPARQVITAGTTGEQAVEHNAWGHGAFTYKLLETLRAEERPLSASKLGVLLKERVPREVVAKFNQTKKLSPQAKYLSGEGDFLFIRPGAKLDAEPDRPAITRPEPPAEAVARLLQTARDNDDKTNGRRALTALDQLLAIEPDHAEALKLRRKIRAYYGAATLAVPTRDYPTIQKALDDANPGDTVRVEAGIYEETLTFREGVRLIGAGADKVTVRCGAKQANVIEVEGITAGLIAGLTAEHVGTDDDEKGRFANLFIRDSNVEVLRCTFQNAAADGVCIDGRSQPTIRECVVQQNPWQGISVNGKEAAPLLRNNQCRGNQQHGIFFKDSAGGTAEGNICENNMQAGISAFEASTAPTLRNNQCRGNLYGIYFGKGAGGTAEGNICENNKQSGIGVYDTNTAPMLRNNQCRDNQRSGIQFRIGAGGTAENNVCEANQADGIGVADTGTQPTLRKNRCHNNKGWGIDFWDNAKPRIEPDNQAFGNKEGQIQRP